jgi:hypothetical protein
MFKARSSLTAPAFLAIVGLAATPVAATTITWPGLECAEADDTASEILYNNGKAFNDDDVNDMEMECPIPRINSDVAGSMADIVVRVDDSHAAEAVECYAQSCNWSVSSCFTSGTVASSGEGFQSLTLGSLSTYSNGPGFISCDVPDKDAGDRSGVLSYRTAD